MTPPIERLSIFVAVVVGSLAVFGITPSASVVRAPERTTIVIGAAEPRGTPVATERLAARGPAALETSDESDDSDDAEQCS